jgi:NhaP-type Na+/H+ or K+/H+ antiporter
MNPISLLVIPLFIVCALIVGFICKAILRNKDEHALTIGIELLQCILTAAILFFIAYNMFSND